MTTSKIPVEARIYNLIDVSTKLNAAKILIKRLASAISRRTLSTNVHVTVNFHKFIHQQYLIRRSYRYHMQPNTSRVKIEFKIWLNKNVKINSLPNARSFTIIIRSHTHIHTQRDIFGKFVTRYEYNPRNQNYRDSAAEQCVKAASASAFDEQRKRWWRRGRSRGYGKPRGTPSPEQALSSSRESTRYQRALATLEQKPREFFADFWPLFEPRRSF